ncbi:MAG: methyltransferase domain-containing protein [Planctomycetota bacterium]|jgi:SAM-dependent methyltransferase
MADPWWQSFFQGVVVDLWMAVGNAEQDRAEADFIDQALQLPTGGTVLDVPCGHGRHAIELATRGFQVTGVDISTDFLSAARAAAADRAVKIRWEQRDMRDLPWAGEFDGVFCFGNSFGYLDHSGNVEFLQAAARTLKAGGRFVLDSGVIAESILPNFQPRRWYEVSDIHMLIENRYDPVNSRLVTDYTFIRGGEVEKRSGSQQVYTCAELRRLLGEAGFSDFQAYSSPQRTPFELAAPRLLLLSHRR